jgi:hypothetical protein
VYSPCDWRITCGAKGTVGEGVTPETLLMASSAFINV